MLFVFKNIYGIKMQTEYDYKQYIQLLTSTKTNNDLKMLMINSILMLDCSQNQLLELPELPPNLQILDCSHNQLISIPDSLPPTLQKLDCYNNQLSKLPETMPPTLKLLDCSNNPLLDLPETLPLALHTLYCSNNQLHKLPDSLPLALHTLYCSNNQLIQLPETLPPALQELDCHTNQLSKLPETLPPTLQTLNCLNNQLQKLPETLPPTLQTLNCSNNQLQKLPGTFPPTLQILYCSYNKLINIPESLPPTLHRIDCSHNQLSKLTDSLPPTLQRIDCEYNQLLKLPESLPPNLRYLDCSDNQLTTLPLSLTHTHSNLLQFSNNPIEYLPVQITRWLNHRVKTNQQVYQDYQSVHNHSIQLGIMDAVTLLTVVKPSVALDQVIEAIVTNPTFQSKSKQLLMEYINNSEVHGTFHLTFAELLTAVWSHILTYPLDVQKEIWKVIDTEMQDAECKCFTGRMSRLVNCLNGFDDRIKIQISDNEQIGNIISIERTKLLSSSSSSEAEAELISQLKTNVALALKERAYSDAMIHEWIEYIE